MLTFIIFLIIWFGTLVGIGTSGLYILVSLTAFTREAINAKRESREIGVQYTDTLKHIGVAFLVGLTLIGLFYILASIKIGL